MHKQSIVPFITPFKQRSTGKDVYVESLPSLKLMISRSYMDDKCNWSKCGEQMIATEGPC